MPARTRPRRRKRNDANLRAYRATQWASPRTGLSYRTQPTPDGVRVDVWWADAFRGVRATGNTVYDRLARSSDEAIAPSDMAARRRINGFEDAFEYEVARKHNGVAPLTGGAVASREFRKKVIAEAGAVVFAAKAKLVDGGVRVTLRYDVDDRDLVQGNSFPNAYPLEGLHRWVRKLSRSKVAGEVKLVSEREGKNYVYETWFFPTA